MSFRGRGRMGGTGQGLGGNCYCPKCGYTTPHVRMQPCMFKRCPNCGIALARKY